MSVKYVSLEKLGLYDTKIKEVISNSDATTLASAKSYSDSLAGNYDAAGAAADALAAAKTYADGKDAAIGAAQAAADAAAAAAGVADGKAVAAQGEVDALELYVGTIPAESSAANVIAYVNEKTTGIATDSALNALAGRVTTAETDIDNIEKDYLKAADKTELQGNIDTVSAAVTAEETRAKGVESGLDSRLAAVEGDYLKAADKTELQGNIDTLTGVVNTLRDGVDAEKVDGVKDLIDYVDAHGTEVTGMKKDISDNAAAISGVDGRLTTAEGNITTLQGAVATKAEQSALDDAIDALEGADTALSGRITTLENKFGGAEGSVEDMIADAQAAAEATAAADATTKANAAEANAKGHADSLNTAMNARVVALEAIDHDHANKAELDLIASGDKAKWDAAAAIAHSHANMVELEKIVVGDKAKWDAAEGNAKTYADGLDTAMNTRVAALETWKGGMVEASEEDINNLFKPTV